MLMPVTKNSCSYIIRHENTCLKSKAEMLEVCACVSVHACECVYVCVGQATLMSAG